jgi:hypothetical protein
LDWLKAKLQDFYTLPARIAALKAKADRLATIADQRAQPAYAAQVRQAAGNLTQTQSMHQALQSKLSGLFAELGKVGVKLPGMAGYPSGASELGIVPLAVLALAAGVAIAIYGVFRHYNTQEKIVNDVAKGLLSADEAKALMGGLSFNVGGALKPLVWVGLAAAGFFFWPQLRRVFGGGR